MGKLHKKNRLLNQILSFPSSCILGLIFILMDCVSYGRALIPATDNKVAENISMFIFLSTSFAAQVIFGVTTNIKSGIIAGTIVENFKIFENIYNGCKAHTDNFDEIIFNTFVCLFLGTMLFSLISFLLMKLKLAKILKIIPKSAITGCFGAIGICQFEIGLKELNFDSKNITSAFIMFLLITVAVSVIAFILQEVFCEVIFIIPLYSAVVISIFHIVCYFFKIEKSVLIANSWLVDEKPIILVPTLITDYLNYKHFSFASIKSNIPNIISLALFSLIHLPINLPVYSLETKIATDFTKELKTQSIANFATAFLFSPTYFVCSNSIFFRRSGGTTKVHTVLLGFSIILLFLYGTKLKSYLPCFVLAMFPFFIGINICYSAFYKSFLTCTITDYAICLITTVVCYFTSIEKGIFIGVFLNALWFMNYYIKSLKTRPDCRAVTVLDAPIEMQKNTVQISEDENMRYSKEYTEQLEYRQTHQLNVNENFSVLSNNGGPTTSDIQIIVIDYIFCFVTLNKFEAEIRELDKKKLVIFDFRKCYCVDWLAKDYFYDLVSAAKNTKIEMIGIPLFLEPAKLKNCTIYKDDKEFYATRE